MNVSLDTTWAKEAIPLNYNNYRFDVLWQNMYE